MTPREVVTRAVEFRRPAGLPIRGCGEVSNVTGVSHKPVKPPEAGDDPDVDQWLCRWGHTEPPNMGQVKGHPLEDLSRMDEFPWPAGATGYTRSAREPAETPSQPAWTPTAGCCVRRPRPGWSRPTPAGSRFHGHRRSISALDTPRALSYTPGRHE